SPPQPTARPPAEPTGRATSAGTMKIPEPIIEPATIMVESRNPSSRMKPVVASLLRLGGAAVLFGIGSPQKFASSYRGTQPMSPGSDGGLLSRPLFHLGDPE